MLGFHGTQGWGAIGVEKNGAAIDYCVIEFSEIKAELFAHFAKICRHDGDDLSPNDAAQLHNRLGRKGERVGFLVAEENPGAEALQIILPFAEKSFDDQVGVFPYDPWDVIDRGKDGIFAGVD